MKTIQFLFTAIVFIMFFSCSSNKIDNYQLKESNINKSFNLDSNTKNSIYFLAQYISKDGKEYLTFQNGKKNEILFYDINTSLLSFKIEPKIDGDNGVGRFLGYYIQNLDGIYLTNYDFQEIAIINKNAIVKDKINYEKADNGTALSFFCFITHVYRPATVIGRKMYIYSGPNRWVENAPVAAILDLDTKSIQALPFTYPQYEGSKVKRKQYGWENDYSRCFDGKRFIYSFDYEEDLYVTSTINHDSIYRVKAKSKFIPKVNWPPEFGYDPDRLCTNQRYGNILYDKYRNVYYRIAYPKTEIDWTKEKVRSMELLEYGGKNFSIIILDKDLNYIGETKFQDYTYNSKLILIMKDGIYISNSHYMNPNFSDDLLSFIRFDLIKNT